MHLRHSGLIRQNRHLFIRRQHIVGAGPIRHLRHGVIAYAQALDEDFTVFIRFEGLVVAVGPGHAEGEALHLAVAGRFFNPQGASLGHVGEANPGLVLYLVDFAVLGDLHIVGVFIQQEALRRFGFPYEHAAVEDVGHLVNASAGFLQLAQQLVTLVQLFVAVGIAVHFKFSARQFVIGIILIHLRQTQVAVHALIGKGDFHNLPIFLHGNGDHFIGEDKTFRAFQLFQHPITVRHIGEREAAILR